MLSSTSFRLFLLHSVTFGEKILALRVLQRDDSFDKDQMDYFIHCCLTIWTARTLNKSTSTLFVVLSSPLVVCVIITVWSYLGIKVRSKSLCTCVRCIIIGEEEFFLKNLLRRDLARAPNQLQLIFLPRNRHAPQKITC